MKKKILHDSDIEQALKRVFNEHARIPSRDGLSRVLTRIAAAEVVTSERSSVYWTYTRILYWVSGSVLVPACVVVLLLGIRQSLMSISSTPIASYSNQSDNTLDQNIAAIDTELGDLDTDQQMVSDSLSRE